jgi:uncharacterized cupredoxin-like copper-binding protein
MTTIRTMLMTCAALAALGFGSAMAQTGHDAHGGHAKPGMAMPGMDMKAMHDAMEKRMMDTSAFGEKGDPAKATRQVRIVASDVKFDTTELAFKTGETVRFTIVNAGEQPHEFTIGDAAYLTATREMMAHMVEMGMDVTSPMHAQMHGSAGNTATRAPGETKELVWRFTKPGKFAFACSMPGHADAGMTGRIAVE